MAIIGLSLASCTVQLDTNYFVGGWGQVSEKLDGELLTDELDEGTMHFEADGSAAVRTVDDKIEEGGLKWKFIPDGNLLVVDYDTVLVKEFTKKTFTIFVPRENYELLLKRVK